MASAMCVLAPLVLCIVALALYPQLILHRADPAVQRSVAATRGPTPETQLASAKTKIVIGGGGRVP